MNTTATRPSTTTLPTPATTTPPDWEVDHYFCEECWPAPEVEVRGFCGTVRNTDSEIDLKPGYTADCVVCTDLAPNPPCGHLR